MTSCAQAKQVLVTWNGSTKCVDLTAPMSIVALLKESFPLVPAQYLECLLTPEREILKKDYVLDRSAVLECRLIHRGLQGGKGGFGAQLRASAKGKGRKKTTDFGSCRDLNGRRLRHVNNEIRLRVWREEQQEREADANFDPSKSKLLQTESGLPNWFLQIPHWAEGVSKKKTKAVVNKERLSLCRDWVTARSGDKRVPENVPDWWGCPRGSGCPFAHGEAKLGPEGKRRLRQERIDKKNLEEANSMRKHVTQLENIERSMLSSISQGLQRSKLEAVKAKGAVGDQVESYVQCLCGDIAVGETGEVQGVSAFGSAGIPSVAISDGDWFFEVEVISQASPNLALQVGCATQRFEPNETSNDGVGDKPGSWAFDPFRNKIFQEGVDRDAVRTTPTASTSLIVGCEIGVKDRKVLFFLNGKPVCESLPLSNKEDTFFYPVVSLEEDIVVRINLGERPFKHIPKSRTAQGFTGNGGLHKAVTGKKRKEMEVFSSGFSSSNSPRETYAEIDLAAISSLEELIELGPEHLKQDLLRRGLKCGGTVQNKAERLFSIKGLAEDQIDDSLKPGVKKRKKKKKTLV